MSTEALSPHRLSYLISWNIPWQVRSTSIVRAPQRPILWSVRPPVGAYRYAVNILKSQGEAPYRVAKLYEETHNYHPFFSNTQFTHQNPSILSDQISSAWKFIPVKMVSNLVGNRTPLYIPLYSIIYHFVGSSLIRAACCIFGRSANLAST